MDDFVAPVVAGYRLGALLGRGSSAAVWGGRRLADGRPVAVKVVPMPAGGEEPAVGELALLRGLGGDHVVSLLDAVPVRDPGEALALVMDRYDGGSLGRVVAARGRLTAGEIVTTLSPVAAALGGLHRAGVVHGDLTPGNVLFDDTGRPAVCDLGVTRIIGERAAEVFGTKGFVAPEVTVGEQPTPASDVYAVGALAWFCATGEAPEPGWLRQPSAEALADLPAALVAVIDACLATGPDERPAAVELSLDLFDSVPAEPLRLPGAADEVESLTRRIRAQAGVGPDSSPAADRAGSRDRGRWWRRPPRQQPEAATPVRRLTGAPPPVRTPGPASVAPPPRGHQARHALAGGSAAPTPVRSRGTGRRVTVPRRGRRPVLSGAATAVLAAVFVTVGGLVAVAAGWEPSDLLPHHAGSAAPVQPAAPSEKPVTGNPSSQSVDLGSAAAVVDHPLGVAQALAEARAAVWGSGDLARVGAVDAPGSPAWADDARRIGEATAGGWRYDAVRFTVRSATLLRHTPTTASVRVVLDSAAYAVVGPRGREARAAASAQTFVLDLVRSAEGWRVSRVDT